MKRQLPKALKAGDEVAVIAPASAVRDGAAFDRGLARLRAWGLAPVVLEHVPTTADGGLDRPEGGTLAATDEERLRDLQNALDEPRYRGVFCARGGYGAGRLLQHIDWTRFRADPKPIVGYSDITALLAAAWREAAAVGFHGPMVATTEAMDPGEANWKLQRALLTDASKPATLPHGGGRTLRAGTAQGALLGGNLALVQSLLATPWQIETDGALLFLEDIGEAPYRVDRMLTQLRQTGALDRAAGILLGDFHVDDTALASVHAPMQSVLEERLEGLSIPVVCDMPFGHRPGSWTLPFGTRARLTAEAGTAPTLELLEPSVR